MSDSGKSNDSGEHVNKNADKKGSAIKRASCFVTYWCSRMISALKPFEGLITAVATVLLTAATILLAFIAYWQYKELHNTDHAFRVQTRAMVYFQTSGWTTRTGGIQQLPRFIMGNSGLTETRNLRYATDCLSSDEEIADPVKQEEAALRSRIIEGYTLGPRQVPDGTGGGIPLCDPARMPQPFKRFLYVYGCASYDDVFGKPHETQFCARVHPLGGEGIDVGGHCKTTRRSCVDSDCQQKSVCSEVSGKP